MGSLAVGSLRGDAVATALARVHRCVVGALVDDADAVDVLLGRRRVALFARLADQLSDELVVGRLVRVGRAQVRVNATKDKDEDTRIWLYVPVELRWYVGRADEETRGEVLTAKVADRLNRQDRVHAESSTAYVASKTVAPRKRLLGGLVRMEELDDDEEPRDEVVEARLLTALHGPRRSPLGGSAHVARRTKRAKLKGRHS